MGDYEFEYELELEFDWKTSPTKIVTFIGCLLKDFLPKSIFHESSIKNLRGRDKNIELAFKWPSQLTPNHEELFFLAGKFESLKNEDDQEEIIEEQQNEASPTKQEFYLQINSSFKEFIGSDQIEHNCLIKRLGIEQNIPSDKITFLPHLEIDAFRIGLEFFESKLSLMPMSFGKSPEINNCLYLDYYAGSLKLKITAEALSSKAQIPKTLALQTLSSIFENEFSYNLLQDFDSKLRH